MKTKNAIPLILVVIAAIAVLAGVLLKRNLLSGETTVSEAALPDATATQSDDSGSNDTAPVAPALRNTPAQTGRQAGASVRERLDKIKAQREAMRSRTQTANETARTRLVKTFDSEKVDTAWAPTVERNLSNVLGKSDLSPYGISSSDVKVECRSTTCQIHSTLANSAQADDWTTLYMTNVGQNLPRAFVTRKTLPDGRVQVEIVGAGGRH